MTERPFVHLHCHTHYSLLDGASRVPELVAHVKSLGMNAVAITDHGNLYGAIEFYRECKDAGLNPILGYEAYVAPKHRTDREAKKRGDAGYHLTLLAKDITGFRNLIRLSSRAYLEGYHYVPRIDKELLIAYKEGLICLSGCASSEFSEQILQGDLDGAVRIAREFSELFGKNFYVEVQNNGLKIQRTCAEGAIEVANRLGLPLVATSDAHYLQQADAPSHDVLLCINTGAKRSDARRMRYGDDGGGMIDQFYVRGPAEMYALFPNHEEAVKRSQEIANGVDIQIDFKKRHFPVFSPPAGKTPDAYLRELCAAGLQERYRGNPPEVARQRLELELGIICRMGFASYFLIVGDFVRFAVDKGIPASARGSACGSLVSYVLKLSHVDPLEYDLLFERFLDPNRAEAPDIDIDFCQDRREEVIAYVKNKYGAESVAQIATFGTMAAKAAIKDVGRVLDVPLATVTQLAGWVPQRLGVTLDDALKESPEFKQAYENDPLLHELIDIARRLEGTNRQAGIHAAGVVIANGPITDYVPVHRAVRKNEEGGRGGEPAVATQWGMGDLEKVGLLKMDFLGLRNLTLLNHCVKLIEKTRGIKIDLYNLPDDDPETYALLQRGDAKGVFQLESEGIRQLLTQMKPDNIRDLVAILALYRPGPLQGGMVDSYVNCKHGRETPAYQHPVMEEVLAETYGVMVFQEQIMRILNRLGGIELSSAYACIKAISKKKQDIIDQRHAEFARGAQERGLSKAAIDDIWNKIIVFAGYGFNKCVVGETTIVHAETGERTTVEDLFQNRRSFVVHALGEDGKFRPRVVEDVVWNGRRTVYRLRTAQGHEITATGNHPFRTLDGWTMLRDLKPGSHIATARRLPVTSYQSWPRHEIIVLAELLSEGNTCHPSTLYFYNNDTALIEDFAESARMFPDTAARIYTRPTGRREVCVNTGRPGGAPRGGMRAESRSCSGAYLWAGRLGILGKKATEKFVPASVFCLRNEDIELFLGRLWAGDGFIANSRLAVPFYATSSRQLANDVQTLLLRLGIYSGVHAKTFKYRGTTRPGYTVHLLGEDSIDVFVRRVAPHCLGREQGLVLLLQHLEQTARGLTSKDTVPGGVRHWVDEERARAGLTWAELERRSGLSMREFCGKGSPHKVGFRRSTLARLAELFGSQRLANLATSDIFWDRVVSIEPAGVQDTYDLSVEEDHNFVADGLVVHNSHSAAYAQVGYQTAYLKAHFTPEFMAALLSSEADGSKRDMMVDHITDARKLGAPVRPPDINTSETDFSVAGGEILFGLLAIKGLSRSTADAIVQARQEGGPYKDLFDFCERLDIKSVPRAAIERLIKVGAFDRFGRRNQLWTVLPRAIQAAMTLHRDRAAGQLSLFGGLDDEGPAAAAPAETLPDVPEWPDQEKLKYEKEALDFYFSSHPLAQHESVLRRFSQRAIDDLKHLPPGAEVVVGGMLSSVRFLNTKNARNGNSRYIRCNLEDMSGSIECLMWPDDFARQSLEVADEVVCFVRGAVDPKSSRDKPLLLLTRFLSVDQAQRELTKMMIVSLRLGTHAPQDVDALGRVLSRTPGSCPVLLDVRDEQGKWARLKLSDEYRVNPLAVATAELEAMFGPGCVKFSGPVNGARGG